jgi:hypothetical protein
MSDQRLLFRECFPETVGHAAEREEHYLWKFRSGSGAPRSCEDVARCGPLLAGYYAAIPYPYRVENVTRTAGMVCDVMTSGQARKRGVFTRLGAHALADMRERAVDFATAFPIRPSVLPGFLKLGWTVVQTMPVYLKVVKTDSLLRSGRLGALCLVGNPVTAMVNGALRFFAGPSPYDVERVTPEGLFNDEMYVEFLEAWMQTVPNALLKEPRFLEWRLGAPGSTYDVFLARDASRAIISVCVALNTTLHSIPTLALLDVMVRPGHGRAFTAVDRALERHARRCGAEVIATMMSPRWARANGLFRIGYLRSRHVFSLVVKKLNAALDDRLLFDPNRWHTMWIDSDDL